MSMQRLFSAYSVAIGTALVVIVALLACIVQNQQTLRANNEIRYQSYLRADEVRQSSDDQTRMARTYTVTGDPRFEDYFHKIVAIRNGNAPRPVAYERIYWDLITNSDRPPRPSGAVMPLQRILRDLGFSEREFKKLAEAQHGANDLVKMEQIAMNAMKGYFMDEDGNFTRKGKPDPDLARRVLHSPEYHNAKARIMLPLDEFFLLLDKRTSDIIVQAEQKHATMMVALLTLVGFVGVSLLSLHRIFRQNVLQPIERLNDAAHQIEGGQFPEQLTIEREDEVGQLTSTFNSMNTSLQHSASKISNLAFKDPLTQLPNRRTFSDRLTQRLRDGQSLALLFLDIDGFKKVNDTIGHAAGDDLLIEVAERLKRCLREDDQIGRVYTDSDGTIARLGGDEFVLLLPGVDVSAQAAAIARRIGVVLAEPFPYEEWEIPMSASIGVTLAPRDGSDPEGLMRNADIAMYEAKRAGRNTHRVYDTSMHATAQKDFDLEHALRSAMANEESGELCMHYQPQVQVDERGQERGLVGYESLLRWTHPQHGPISPTEFIPIAEKSGLILSLGDWIINQVCSQVSQWIAMGLSPPRVAINISSIQLAHGNLEQVLHEALEDAELSPEHIEVEITETIIAQATPEVLMTLQRLRRRGITVALDDFGTGYSSLGTLSSLPIDRIKIDRSFIAEADQNASHAAIVSTIMALGDRLELEVLAEGVESESQLHMLAEEGCTTFQGFLLGHPVDPETIADQMKAAAKSPIVEAAIPELIAIDAATTPLPE